MASASSMGDPLSQLVAKGFAGHLLRSGEPGYDQARHVHNGLIDKHPALIARCCGAADVTDTVRIARELGLEIAVRGGGHNVAGRATTEGGIMIDLSAMRGVHVDPRRATARAQGGTTWAEFNRETQLHGLATTGGVVSTTGIAGLTLGGGIGWLMGRHGLALDNLLSAEVVLADGSIVMASLDERPDLFWALRGGGGNFGVVTSFEYRLHPVGPMVTAGLIAYPFATAWDLLRTYRDITAELPDDMMVFAGLLHAPDGSGEKLAGLVVFHCGPSEVAARALAPIRAFGTPLIDAIATMPYTAANGMLDAGYPKGALNYWKSSFLGLLSDAALQAMIDCFARCPAPMGQLLIEHLHGAVTRVAPTDTAFPHRTAGYNMLVLSQWTDQAATEACVAWARDSYAALQPHASGGRYVNYLGDDEGDGALATAYGPNYRRLQQVKAKYDPENVWRLNQNIQPLA